MPESKQILNRRVNLYGDNTVNPEIGGGGGSDQDILILDLSSIPVINIQKSSSDSPGQYTASGLNLFDLVKDASDKIIIVKGLKGYNNIEDSTNEISFHATYYKRNNDFVTLFGVFGFGITTDRAHLKTEVVRITIYSPEYQYNPDVCNILFRLSET